MHLSLLRGVAAQIFLFLSQSLEILPRSRFWTLGIEYLPVKSSIFHDGAIVFCSLRCLHIDAFTETIVLAEFPI